jgi:hypothetical protein
MQVHRYFSIPDEEIKPLESVLTIVGDEIVYATEEFSKLAHSTEASARGAAQHWRARPPNSSSD